MSAPPPSGARRRRRAPVAAAPEPAIAEALTPERFAVEADRRVVGVAVRGAGGFRFFSSDPDYAGLEAQTFPRVRALMHRIGALARALAKKRRRRRPRNI